MERTAIFIIIGVILVILLTGIGIGYSIGKRNVQTLQPIATQSPSPQINSNPLPTSTPAPSLSPSGQVGEGGGPNLYRFYNGNLFTFKHPSFWNPTPEDLEKDAIFEIINLGIPGNVSNASLGFRSKSIANARPENLIIEENIILGGKRGYKWVSGSGNQRAYDYITTGLNNRDIFQIHAEVPKEDTNLESYLDELASSVQFKQP